MKPLSLGPVVLRAAGMPPPPVYIQFRGMVSTRLGNGPWLEMLIVLMNKPGNKSLRCESSKSLKIWKFPDDFTGTSYLNW